VSLTHIHLLQVDIFSDFDQRKQFLESIGPYFWEVLSHKHNEDQCIFGDVMLLLEDHGGLLSQDLHVDSVNCLTGVWCLEHLIVVIIDDVYYSLKKPESRCLIIRVDE
jgi:hypothetical protein